MEKMIEIGDTPSNMPNALRMIENEIKELYGNRDNKMPEETMSEYRKRIRPQLQKLLHTRQRLLDKMFVMDEDSYRQLEHINHSLVCLTQELARKTQCIYADWRANMDDEWADCNVESVIFAEGCRPDCSDELGSDYEYMLEVIEDMISRNVYQDFFSGDKDGPGDIPRTFEEINNEYPKIFSSAYGNFTCCSAFDSLMDIYSLPDILHIAHFWAEARLVHQRIIEI